MSVEGSQLESGYHSSSRAGDGANSNDSGAEEGGGGGGGGLADADVTANDVREALLRRGGVGGRSRVDEKGEEEEDETRSTVADAVDILKLSFILQARQYLYLNFMRTVQYTCVGIVPP